MEIANSINNKIQREGRDFKRTVHPCDVWECICWHANEILEPESVERAISQGSLILWVPLGFLFHESGFLSWLKLWYMWISANKLTVSDL